MKQILKNSAFRTLIMLSVISFFIGCDLVCNKAKGQPFAAIGIVNKGAKFECGTSIKKVELKLSYQLPMTSNEAKKITAVQVGYEISINDRFYLMPGAGYAYRKWTDFSEYDKGGQRIYRSDYSPVVNCEVGVNGYAGKCFISYSYVKDSYFGIGLRVYFTQL